MTTFTQNIVVLGAGVIGLTTALELLRLGYKVAVVADHFPGEYHADYTSPWAGAHWRSYANNDDLRHIEYDKITYNELMKLAKGELKDIIKVVPNYEYHEKEGSDLKHPWFKNFAQNYSEIPKEHLPEGYSFGLSYDAVCIHSMEYLKWLFNEGKKLGLIDIKLHMNHIKDAYNISSFPTNIVINCCGLGARTMDGVKDPNIFPTRGQTILVHAPEVDYTSTGLYKGGVTYIIPKGDGTVILGGTQQEHNYKVQPDEDIAEDILKRCQKLSGGLGPCKIISHNVGFRPTRKGGVRSEVEYINLPDRKNLILCHQYGHGGFGYQSSWGSARCTIKLLLASINKDGSIRNKSKL
ncbi:nucleotide-binding domain-containing protein [Neoconidiobolus thromboides FSU 785]|nr:nucleotide-binding domain-containing protein [Neoconidiobolus thromboides FSU 785]